MTTRDYIIIAGAVASAHRWVDSIPMPARDRAARHRGIDTARDTIATALSSNDPTFNHADVQAAFHAACNPKD